MLNPSKNAYNKYRKSIITRHVSENGRLFQMIYLTTEPHDSLLMEDNARKFSPPLFYNPAINTDEITIAAKTGGKTLSPPAIIEMNDQKYIFWTSRGSCYYSVITDNTPSEPAALPIPDGNFTTTPGVRFFDNKVHLAWSDKSNNIQYAAASVDSIGSNWNVKKVAAGAAPKETPAVITRPQTNTAVIFYRNTQNRVLAVSPGGNSRAITHDGSSLESKLPVSVCLYQNTLWLACSEKYISAGTVNLQNNTFTLKQTFQHAPRLALTRSSFSLSSAGNSLLLSWVLLKKEIPKKPPGKTTIEKRVYLMLTQDGEYWQSRQPVYGKTGNTPPPVKGTLSPQAVTGDTAQIHYSYLNPGDSDTPASIRLVSCPQNNLSEGGAPKERTCIPWLLNKTQTPSTSGEIATGGGDNPLLRAGFLISALCMEYLHNPRFTSGLHYAEKLFEFYEESELKSKDGKPTGFFMRRSNHFNKHSYNRPASGDEITGLILGLLRLYMAFIQVPEKKALLKRIVAMADRLGTFLKENFYFLFPPLKSEIKDQKWPYWKYLGQETLIFAQYPVKNALQKITGKTYDSTPVDIANTVARALVNCLYQEAEKNPAAGRRNPASSQPALDKETAALLKAIDSSGILQGDETADVRQKLQENAGLFQEAEICDLISELKEIKECVDPESKLCDKILEALIYWLASISSPKKVTSRDFYIKLVKISQLINDAYYKPKASDNCKKKINGAWFNVILLQHSFFMALDLNAKTKEGSILYAGETHNMEHLYMAWADQKNKQLFHFARSFNGQFWQHKFSKKLDILDNTAPAACFLNERHYVFYINKSKKIAGLSISPEGNSENLALPSQGKLTQSLHSPSVTTANGKIYVALSNQTSQKTITLLVYKNKKWQAPKKINGIQNVKGKPALAFSKDSGKTALAWRLEGFATSAEFYVALLNKPDRAPATSQKATVQGAYPNPESFQIAPAKENFTVAWGNISKKVMYTTYAGKSATHYGLPVMDKSRQMQYRRPFGLTEKSGSVFLSAAPQSSGVINIYSQSANSWQLVLSCDSGELGNTIASYLESFLIHPKTGKIRNADLHASGIVRFLESQMIQTGKKLKKQLGNIIDQAAVSMQPDCPVAEPMAISNWSQKQKVRKFADFSWINKAPVQAHNTQTFSLGDALIGTDFCWEKGPDDKLRILSFASTRTKIRGNTYIKCTVNTDCPDTGISGTCTEDNINECLLSVLYAGDGPDYPDTFIEGCGIDYLYPRAILGLYDPENPFDDVDQTLYPVLPVKDQRPVYPDHKYDPHQVQTCADGCKGDKP